MAKIIQLKDETGANAYPITGANMVDGLANVAKTGSYNDLSNKPTIPTVPSISTNVVEDKLSDTKTSSPKSVYNEIHPSVGSSQPSGGMLPNTVYNLGILSGNITFSLATPSDISIVNHYYWTFSTSSTAPIITWPAGITSWIGGNAPTISASKHYEVSVLNGVGVYFEV